ncbi:aminotransferase class I/II-fold pyridoxal phosphate-dependent enzyme [Pontibacter diazotrophicus]|uniref:Aminotransferase class I/II-fold pyridoxal phosphate-dependent enzyme n=1 Tax=Pontibacter diazotrophicus TaxID=1400979 RepID=A0A3D8L855_9BACT|nr:aminotransferase class I/II-fold pyridoxal phosphate-dependent enzyme [Pontibacter diazotrophicus]RDV13476.1 aminotransferase class I/II-fold pyridoxal phosphate-dependent enzyme [Pontibacter diazotrophicus]
MATELNRRDWIRSSALIAAGLYAVGLPNLAKAAPASLLVPPRADMHKILADLPRMQARLTSNENPFGPSDKAKKALLEAVNEGNRYARERIMSLRSAIAKEEGVSEEHVMLGAGSSDILLAAALNYASKGGAILSADPTYASLVRSAVDVGAGWEKVPLTKDYAHDLDAMEKKVNDDISLVYIVNPNNPTATITPSDKLRSFCEVVSRRKPIFIDEAYIDYVDDPKGQSMVDCVRKGQNVIIARTFSKVHGFAGLRVGYAIAQPEVIKELSKYTNGAFNVSATSASAALASLQDKEFTKYCVQKNKEAKDYTYSVLKKEGYAYLPSHTNFIMFPLKMNGKKFSEEMLKRGVGLRNWEFYDQQWCRVSLGTMEDMKLFADAFKQIS